MSATIFTGWHLLTYGTATNIIFVGAAVLVLRSKVRESRDYMAAGDAAFASAEQRDAAFEETRNKPWYWPTGPAIEADKPLDATVLHVKYPTQELRLVTDDPQVAAGLDRLADEVGLVQALSDRPAVDDDEVGDEQPGEAWFARLKDGFDDMARGVTDAINWPIKLARQVAAAWRRRRDERYLIGSGEQATDRDPFAELLAHVEAKPIVLDPDDEAALQAEHKAWKAANPPTNPQPYTGRHWVSDVQHTSAWPLIIPKPRDGEADV